MSLSRLATVTLCSLFAAGAALAQDATPAAAPAASSSMKGKWVGLAEFQGDSRQVNFAFDSTETGWVGSTVVAEIGPDPIYLDPIKISKDSVAFGIPVGGDVIGVRGKLAGNVYVAELVMQGSVVGSVRMARAGSAEAAQLLTPPAEWLDDHR